jgi:hypothetical protein
VGKEEWMLVGTPKKTTNTITRELIEPVINNLAVGTEFFCGDVVRILTLRSSRSGRRELSSRQVAPFLSERNDLKLINRSKGLWKKVKESNDV